MAIEAVVDGAVSFQAASNQKPRRHCPPLCWKTGKAKKNEHFHFSNGRFSVRNFLSASFSFEYQILLRVWHLAPSQREFVLSYTRSVRNDLSERCPIVIGPPKNISLSLHSTLSLNSCKERDPTQTLFVAIIFLLTRMIKTHTLHAVKQ
jgi:hypothetical protein